MKRTQRGMTLIGFIIVLAVVGIFAYVAMKLVPMYSEYYAVKSALMGLRPNPASPTATRPRSRTCSSAASTSATPRT